MRRQQAARRGAAVLAAAGAALVALAAPAAAHPLGNFTVNTADRVLVRDDGVRVVHVVDLAEIPTLQLSQGPDSPDADRDGTRTDAELAAWAARACATAAGRVALTLDGTPAPLRVDTASAALTPGAAGLPTQRLECGLVTDRAPREQVRLDDPTGADRTGWKEVTGDALCGRVTGGDVLRTSPSALLTRYPADRLSSPLDVTSAAFTVDQGGACRADGATPGSRVLPGRLDGLTSAYTDLVGRQELTPGFVLLAVLLSVLLGAGHAVAPGHGKTVLAAYLVGQRGTRRQALWLGATVTATHTTGVLLLGALLSLASVAAPERYVPATEVASGLLLAGVGVFLLRRAVRARAHPGHSHAPEPALVGAGAPAGDHPPHDHGHEHHDHGHEHHDHGHQHHEHASHTHSHGGPAHSHLPPDDRPLGWRTLATMGVAGGLVPSPSALVVLLGATALGRPVLGVGLVVGYGVGMALTLTLAGLLLLRTARTLERRGWTSGRAARLGRLLPLLTAGTVLVVGLVVVLRGLLTFRGLG